MSTLLSGNYTKVPIMTGAVFNDGYLIVQQTYDYLLKPDNLHHDEYFLKYKIIDQMTESFAMDLGYAFKKEIQNSYFYPSEMGNFDQMIRGLKDVCCLVHTFSANRHHYVISCHINTFLFFVIINFSFFHIKS